MIRREILILAVLALPAGCEKRSVVEPGSTGHTPATLRFGLASYMTPGEVQLVMRDAPAKVLEDSPSPPGDACPRFDVLSLSFTDRRDLGHSGELQLTFVNGLLHSVWFYPDDYDSYTSTLAEAGVFLDPEGEFLQSADVRGWTHTAFDRRRYVAWEDVRLAEEIRDWIVECS